MKALLVLLLVWLASLMWSPTSRAFVDPPTFVPAEPVAGQPIQMYVRFGGCHSLSATFPRGTPAQITVGDSYVEVVLDGASVEDPILCNFRGGTSQWNLGSLPAGDYNVGVRIRQEFPPFAVLPTIAESKLTVLARAASPQVVTTASQLGLLTLGLTVGVVGALVLWRRRGGTLGLLALLAVWPMSEGAAQQEPQWLFLELSRSNSAPSPEALVEGRDAATGRALLVGLDAEPPEGISYFVPPPYRARGDFQTYLQANPNVPRARLEQTVVVRYLRELELGCGPDRPPG